MGWTADDMDAHAAWIAERTSTGTGTDYAGVGATYESTPEGRAAEADLLAAIDRHQHRQMRRQLADQVEGDLRLISAWLNIESRR